MKTSIIFALILLSNVSFAQVLFNKTYIKPDWDYANAVIERHDGKYLIAGSSRSQASTDYDINILLVDSLGNIIWDKYLGLANTMEFGFSLIETSDNNYLLSGSVGSFLPYVLKFDSLGNFIWDKSYNINSNYFGGFAIGETLDTNYYFVKPYNSSTSSTLFKIDTQGNALWTKHYDSLICFSAIQTADRGFALIGNNIAQLNQDIKFIKTDSLGDIVWTKSFGGSGNDDATTIQQLPDDGYLIAGTFDPQIIDEESETYVIRTNSAGDTIWTNRYYHLGIPNYLLKCTNNTGYVLSTTRDFYPGFPQPDEHYLIITKLDTLGNIQWRREFDGNTYKIGNNIAETSDGGFLLTGSVDNYPNYEDMLLIKLDSAGNYVQSVINLSNPNSFHVFAFPNPANNEINFQINSAGNNKIDKMEIHNSIGQIEKYIYGVNENALTVNIKGLPMGIYFYKLTSTEKQIATGMFVVGEE